MHFHANYVSTSVFGDGDYYQAMFQAEQDTDDPDSPYLLIQRNSKIQMTIGAISKRITKNLRSFSIAPRRFRAAEVVNRARSSERQSYQRHLRDGGHGARGSITGGKDH